MNARYEFWLSGPVPERSSFPVGSGGQHWTVTPLEPEEMLKRLVLALRGAGYTVRSYAYDCIIEPVEEAVSHPGPTIERDVYGLPTDSAMSKAAAGITQPQGETDE